MELDSLDVEDFEKICDAVALEMELGCQHIIVTLRGTEKTILEINHKKNYSRGILANNYYWFYYVKKHPHIFDNFDNKSGNIVKKWMTLEK